MTKEDFSLLENIVEKSIAENSDPTKFDFENFVSEMEKGFTELGFRENYTQGVENILILRLDALGDFVLTTPAIRELRKNFPYAKITLAVSNRNRSLAELCPYVNRIVLFKGINYDINNLPKVITDVAKFSKEYFWKDRYQLCFYFKSYSHVLHQIIAYMSGAKEKIGYVVDSARIFTDNIVPKEESLSYKLLSYPVIYPKTVTHDVERNLYLLKAYGLQVRNLNPELWYNYSDLLRAKEVLENFGEGKVKVAVGIGASQGERKYPIEQWLPAFEKIIEKGAALIILGGPKELEEANFLRDNLPAGTVLNLAELHLGWRVDVAVMSQLDMYVGNFTGACDVASAAKLPVIALSSEAKNRSPMFNNISLTRRFYPWQTKSIILQPVPIGECAKRAKRFSSGTCVYNNEPHCIKQIKPEEIVAAYDKMVDYIKTAKKVTIQPLMSDRHSVANLCSVSKLKHQKNLPLLTGFDAEVSSNFNFVSK